MLISGIAFALGEMLVCVAGIGIHSVEHSAEWWRILLLACVIPDLIGFPLAWFFVPESPSWLIMRQATLRFECVCDLSVRAQRTPQNSNSVVIEREGERKGGREREREKLNC
jgi:hypothetical protein